MSASSDLTELRLQEGDLFTSRRSHRFSFTIIAPMRCVSQPLLLPLLILVMSGPKKIPTAKNTSVSGVNVLASMELI